MKKITFQFLLSPNKRSDGKQLLHCRITYAGKHCYINTNIYLSEKHWNKKAREVRKTAPNPQRINLAVQKWQTKMQLAIITLQEQDGVMSLERIKAFIVGGDSSFEDFVSFVKREIQENKGSWGLGTLNGHKSKVTKLANYSPSINIHKIDYRWLEEYQYHLTKDPQIQEGSTVHSHMKFLRTMLNRAYTQSLTENQPFRRFKLKCPSHRRKEHLIEQERKKLFEMLEEGDLPKRLQNTLHFFLIACYTGLRVSDWPQCRNLSTDGILTIRQTKKDGKVVEAPANDRAKWLIQKLPDSYRDYTGQRHNMHLKEIMEIAGIDKHISSHCARHTFVMAMLNEWDIPLEIVASFIDDKVSTLEKHYAYYLNSKKKKVLVQMKENW